MWVVPFKPKRPCSVPGCPAIAEVGSRCAAHAREYKVKTETPRASSWRLGYDTEWRKLRVAFLRRHPVCEMCGEPATQVDHIVPKSRGGGNEWENLQALCRRHHSAKSARYDGGFGNAKRR